MLLWGIELVGELCCFDEPMGILFGDGIFFILFLTLKTPKMFLKIFHVFICLLKYKNLNNEYALDIVKGQYCILLQKKNFKNF